MKRSDATMALGRLIEIMSKLRGPDGCPWDREQTPQSLAPYVIEEACEVVEAIESDDPEAICEELGDLLLQVVFQACIFRERDAFDIASIAHGISDKLVRRHPHVFADLAISDPEELKTNWNRIKAAEKKRKNRPNLSDNDIPHTLPALMRAQKLLDKDPQAAQAAINRGLPVLSGIGCKDTEPKPDADEVADGLLAMAALGNRLGIDCEQALRKRLREISRQDG